MSRVAKVVERLDDLDAFVVERPVDLFYLTGLEMSAGTLVVGREESRLFVDGRYLEVAEKRAHVSIAPVKEAKEFLKKFKRIGFDSAVMSYERYASYEQELIPHPDFMRWIRAVKDPEELTYLKKAGALAVRGYNYIKKQLREGVTERELAAELEIFWLKEGGEKLSFDPIIAFGPHTAMPHYRPDNVPLKKDTPVLFDMGVQVHHYQSDLTRVDFFGTPDPKIQEIYEVVRQAKAAATDRCRQGVPSEELDEAARDVITSAGYGEHFVHNLGHGVGLEVHELPRLRKQKADCLLKSGMVITIEPGIYLPGIGGVRLEDTVVVTETGCEHITH